MDAVGVVDGANVTCKRFFITCSGSLVPFRWIRISGGVMDCGKEISETMLRHAASVATDLQWIINPDLSKVL